MLIRTFVLDRVNCHWTLRWLTYGQWKALPHVGAMAFVLTCGPTIHHPPGVTVPPGPPPIEIVVIPPSPFPPPWSPVVPPEDTYVPAIPTAFVPAIETPEGPQETFGAPPFLTTALPPYCPPETPSPSRPVDEPGPLSWFCAALVLVGIWKALKWS